MSPAFRNILLLSGLLRVVLAVTFADLPPRYDETEFLKFGRDIHETGASPNLWRAPGYQWFVAGGLFVAGGRPVGVRILQVLVSVAAALVAYRIGRKIGGEKAGFWSGTFLAFYPSHVAFSHLLWSEAVYGFLVLFAFERLLAADRDDSLRTAAVAGLLLGAATLTRSVGLALLAVSALWLFLGNVRERGAKRALTLAATGVVAAGIVILPWSIRASSAAGRLVIVDVNSGFNLWSGNNEYIPADAQGIWAVGLPLENGIDVRFDRTIAESSWRDEVRRRQAADGVREQFGPDGDDWYRSHALREMRERPGGVLRRAPKKLAGLWSPDFFLPRHLVRDWYGETSPALAAMLVLLTWAAAAVPLLIGPGALAVARRDRFRSLAIGWVVLYLAVHSLAYGHSRMHQPLVPLLVLAVVALAVDPERRADRRLLLRRAAPWSALALAAWIFVWPQLGGLYLAPGPRHAGIASAVAAGRGLPLPGAERLTWMLASVEASRGRTDRARRDLENGRHAELPWSLYLRALLAADVREATDLLDRCLALDPELEPARRFSRQLAGPDASGSRP